MNKPDKDGTVIRNRARIVGKTMVTKNGIGEFLVG